MDNTTLVSPSPLHIYLRGTNMLDIHSLTYPRFSNARNEEKVDPMLE